MVKNSNRNVIASVVLAYILKTFTYVVGGFNFGNKPLLSLYSLYDFIILLIYTSIILFVINKIIAKKDQNKKK